MEQPTGMMLLQAVADRIIARYLTEDGYGDVRIISGRPNGYTSSGVDVAYRYEGKDRRIKIKPDAYFGTDQKKVQDRDLTFYRSEAGHYAFESISNHMTREPGWMFNSKAEELFYYYLVLPQSEEEIAALLSEQDDIFFSELKVDRDELRVMPMKATREWFEQHFEEYAPRPVTVGNHSAWYRLIPQNDIDNAVSGIKTIGSVFAKVAQR